MHSPPISHVARSAGICASLPSSKILCARPGLCLAMSHSAEAATMRSCSGLSACKPEIRPGIAPSNATCARQNASGQPTPQLRAGCCAWTRLQGVNQQLGVSLPPPEANVPSAAAVQHLPFYNHLCAGARIQWHITCSATAVAFLAR